VSSTNRKLFTRSFAVQTTQPSNGRQTGINCVLQSSRSLQTTASSSAKARSSNVTRTQPAIGSECNLVNRQLAACSLVHDQVRTNFVKY